MIESLSHADIFDCNQPIWFPCYLLKLGCMVLFFCWNLQLYKKLFPHRKAHESLLVVVSLRLDFDLDCRYNDHLILSFLFVWLSRVSLWCQQWRMVFIWASTNWLTSQVFPPPFFICTIIRWDEEILHQLARLLGFLPSYLVVLLKTSISLIDAQEVMPMSNWVKSTTTKKRAGYCYWVR